MGCRPGSARISLFADRCDAGTRLGVELRRQGIRSGLLFGILRGGLVVARSAGAELELPAHGLAVLKIRAPRQDELAIGAVTATGPTHINKSSIDRLGVNRQYLDAELADRQRAARVLQRQFGVLDPGAITAADSVVVVDDGLATGATAIAAAACLSRLGGKELIIAVPVAPPSTVRLLLAAGFDRAVCLRTPADFYAVGQFYAQFLPVGQAQLRELAIGPKHLP